MGIRAVIFDLDGTIVESPYNWPEIREKIGAAGQPILSYLSTLKEPEKSRQMRLLAGFEKEATKKARLKKGIKGFLSFLKKKGILIALVTNNTRKNVDFLVRKFGLQFDIILTRESGLWKPSGAPFQEVMTKLGVKPAECAVVGDSLFDLKAGQETGVKRIFLLGWGREKPTLPGAEVHPSVSSLREKFANLVTDKPRRRKRQKRDGNENAGGEF